MSGSAALPAAAAGAVRPYAPSWLDRLMAGIERTPFAPWLALAVIGAGALLLTSSLGPLSGQPLTFDPAQTYFALLLPATMWLFWYLGRLASSALDAFRPLLEASDAEIADLRYRLTVVPARDGWLLAVAAVLWTIEGYTFQPAGEAVAGLSPAAIAVRGPFEAVATAVLLVTFDRTVRQLRLVDRIHARASHIDLYQPAPLYAFSSLTARTGMALFLLFAVPIAPLIPGGAEQAAYAVAAAWVLTLLVVSVAAFVIPLEGMHARITARKRDLEAEVGRRLTVTTETIHRAVDAGDLGVADGLDKQLSSLIAERELIEKLPTWPWRPGTLGAFATALVLPVVLWLVTRLLERVV